MLNKNKIRLIALRSIKSSILLHEKSDSGTNTLTKEKEMQILMKNVKQRNDSKELYVKEIKPSLKEKFGLKNLYMGPKINKIVINMGLGIDGNDNKIIKSIIMGEKTCQYLI